MAQISYNYIDQGTLRVDLLDGKDIPAADRGGVSHIFVMDCFPLT